MNNYLRMKYIFAFGLMMGYNTLCSNYQTGSFRYR